MSYKRSAMRYAHTTGHTGIVYTDNGEYILTCGSDGDIRRWRSIDDDDPTSNCLGEFVNCIDHYGDKLLASSDRNTVQRYTFPEIDKDGTLLRFTAPVTCLRVFKEQELIVAGSEDASIKVMKGFEGTTTTTEAVPIDFQGHTGPVLALDVSLAKEVLASVAGDGELKLWNLKTGALIKSIVGLLRTNSFEATSCYGTPVFEPQQQRSLAYVSGREVIVLNTQSWEVQCTLTHNEWENAGNDGGFYTCCRFSHDGLLLAAGTSGGQITIFDFIRRQVVRCEAPASDCRGITCLAWHPLHNKELAYCDASGQLGTLFSSAGPAVETSIVKKQRVAAAEGDRVDFGDLIFDGAEEDEDDDGAASALNGHHEDDDEEDDENCVSLEKLKSRVMATAGLAADGITALDLLDDGNSRDSLAKSVAGNSDVPATPQLRLFKQQTAFQPTATPSHLEHRYMVWNEVGVVTAHADSADGAIDVEFHDASVHHGLHIPNYAGHTMAGLSTSLLALAAAGHSRLVCIALAASGNKEWSLQLPDCEGIEALAVTRHLVGVATGASFVRLFTAMGTQREVLSLPGPVVAMAGHEEDALLVCYHSAPASERQQYLSAMWLRADGGLLRLRCETLALPLVRGRQLAWLGFSDCGSPAFHDSMGLLQLYSPQTRCWHPICDTLKQSSALSNNYFVIAVSERQQLVQAVLCRGSSYPMTNPRPMLQELAMQLPLCDVDEERAQLEDALVRSHLMPRSETAEKTIKESAIKLFALACRGELEARAKELIEICACPELLGLAVKYATKLGRIHLADRMAELRPQMEEQQQQQQQQAAERAFEQRCLALDSPISRPSTPAENKLAPKAMELSTGRRSALKRFALAQGGGGGTPTAKGLSGRSSNGGLVAALESPATPSLVDTQENIFGSEMEEELLYQVASAADKDRVKESSTSVLSPLNTKNPFGMKRKLSDVEFVSSANGFASKLKKK